MTLKKGKHYFIKVKEVILRSDSSHDSAPLNHLILGDWLEFLGSRKNAFIKVKCRNDEGWIPKGTVTKNRLLEVNFVDIGQGDGCHIVTPDDEVILIDAGISENMKRFISWRYNLINRSSRKKPFPINYVIISHPDKDHYYGFNSIFSHEKLSIEKVFHNGIVERPTEPKVQGLTYPSNDDLGGYMTVNKKKYLYDIVTSDSEMKKLIRKHKNTRKQYLGTIVTLVNNPNNKNVKFRQVSKSQSYIENFDDNNDLTLKVLAPIIERVEWNGEKRNSLRKLGNEGVTKNGHSIVIKLKYGNLSMILGGDLNTESQDFLIQNYADTDVEISKLEDEIKELQNEINPTEELRNKLSSKIADLDSIIAKGRITWQADIVKACHHGSHHFSESFLKILNSLATVISSGDNESYSHPRPDALGAFGKYARGARPLIFSTELARSTNEFTDVPKIVKDYLEKKEAFENATGAEKVEKEKDLELRIQSNVAVYGLITVRSDGTKTILAQKLEQPSGEDKKWDIYELKYNKRTNQLEYDSH